MCISMDRFWRVYFWYIVAFTILVYCCGCGPGAKSDMPVETNTRMIDENKHAIKGNANEIQVTNKKISVVSNNVTSQNEALEKTLKQDIEKVGRDVNSVQENVTNSMWYAFGVLIIIGSFCVLILVIVLYFYRGFKGFGRK